MKASVIITTYNYAAYIEQAITSVLAQAYTGGNIEVWVIDDGSTDDTAARVAPYVAAGQVQYIWQPNAGKAAATKLGIEKATGDVLFTLDADDYFLPGKIAHTVAILEQYPKVVHVASPACIRWTNNPQKEVAEAIPSGWLDKSLPGMDLLKSFYNTNKLFGGGSTFSCRMQVAKAIYWTPAIDMYTDEWLVIQALLQGDSYFLPAPLSIWQIHEHNYSVQRLDQAALQQKHRRLQASSATILSLLNQGCYPSWLRKVYGLKHFVRVMGWKEKEGTKTWLDRLNFCRHCLLQGYYPLWWWWIYRIPLRMLK